jgi:Tfp pilus assembly protein PilX
MIMNKFYRKSGYAILFTLVVVSVITAITIGVSNSVYKQLVLSSLARDSQVAFYAADTAAECAIYATEVPPGISALINSSITCGLDDHGSPFIVAISQDISGIYHLDSTNLNGSCFKVSVDKNIPPTTIMDVKGYNTCNVNDVRKVERGIRVEYQ